MPVHNVEVEVIFNKIADLLEIKGANPYRIRAYRNAAMTIGGLAHNVVDLIRKKEDLTKLPGIGKDLAQKIKKIVETGELRTLNELKKEIDISLIDLLKIPGLGPKKVKKLHEKLGIKSLQGLKKAAKKKKVREVEGFGKKTEANILKEIERLEEREKRTPYDIARQYAEPLISYLKKKKGVKQVKIAGSFRRCKETVGDLDILLSCKKGTDAIEHFVNYEEVADIISQGKSKSTVILDSGLQVDLRVISTVSWGAALHYFTGSKAHNIAIRKLALKKDLKINEYGVFKNDKRIASKSEKEVYKQVDLPYIPPELRERRGEIKAAAKDRLPKLITLDDIQGDLHMHTKKSDGHNTILEMAKAAKKKGYKYIAITEHSKHTAIAGGLNAKELAKHIKNIEKADKKIEGISILKGIEVDILEDGSLDLPDDILKKLDVVICAVHYKFDLSKKKQTSRIIKALENPLVNILAHPTGRLIQERDPYDVDMEKIMKAAKENGCFLELNSHPDRLDLNDAYCKMAKEMGLKLSIDTDAHSTEGLDYITYGINQARRGWLEANDVINTRSLSDLKKLLKKELK